MRVTQVSDVKDDARPRRRAPVLWPWVLVVAAWTIAGLSVLTNQSYLINHHYLLEESHLPVLVALLVFLACWQVMTVGMMLPSSMPMVYMIVHAGRQQRRPYAVPGAFLAGYAARLDGVRACGCFWEIPRSTGSCITGSGSTPISGYWRDHLRRRGSVPVQPAQGTLSQAVPQPVQLLRALLSQGGRSSLASGPTPRRVLPGLLLGTDAGHVWGG